MTTAHTAVPEHLRADFDVYDPGIAGQVDHFNERVGELAAMGPVVHSSAHGGHWIVTGYQEAHAVLRDPVTFSSYPNNLERPAVEATGVSLQVEARTCKRSWDC